MHLISLLFLIPLTLLTPWLAVGQSANVPHTSPYGDIVERYEIRTGNLRHGLYSDQKPLSRENVGDFLTSLDTFDLDYSAADEFNLAYLHSDNLPWSADDDDFEDNESPLLRYFYRSKANFYQVNTEHLNLFVNPGLYVSAGNSQRNDNFLYRNTRSVEVRGNIDDKVGFYSYISENQTRPAAHERAFRDSMRSLPGTHLNKSFREGGVDFFQARGYITFSPTQSISVQFGQDRNFIGNGYRSLMLSDFATDYPFLKINTDVWRFNYQNLFMRLTDRYASTSGYDPGDPYPPKYVAMHYLSFNVLDNLSIGLFESVTFHDNQGSGRGFDVNYLNPVIFYRSVEHQIGDPDKMQVGMNLNYLPVKDVQLYGQLVLHEFRLNDLRDREGHVGNKYGYQAGLRYIDMVGISNLDLNLEWNSTRPYSYAHYNISRDYPVNSYVHYNQPLAHPLGANFHEGIVSLEYQPFPRITLGGRYIGALYGEDEGDTHWGRNIFRSYRENERELGNYTGQGVRTRLDIINGFITYQPWHNIFIDLDARYRSINSEIESRNTENYYLGIALRVNMGRSEWDF